MSGEDQDALSQGWQRLDKWLWCARFMKARSDCAGLIAEGSVRINRQPTDKPHAKLRVGDIVTLPLRHDVRVIEVLGLAERRGPAPEARLLYREIMPAESDGSVPCASPDMAAYRRG